MQSDSSILASTTSHPTFLNNQIQEGSHALSVLHDTDRRVGFLFFLSTTRNIFIEKATKANKKENVQPQVAAFSSLVGRLYITKHV